MPRVLLHPNFRRLAGCALVAGATWGCASDESARRAVAELASVQRELAEMRAMHQGNTRELAELGSRMRGIESEQVYGHLSDPASLERAVSLAHGPREFPRYELAFKISKRKRFKITGTLIGSELHVEAASIGNVA